MTTSGQKVAGAFGNVVKSARKNVPRKRRVAAKIEQTAESKQLIRQAVTVVATTMGVAWEHLLSDTRGSRDDAMARGMAMALACELGVPVCLVARSFTRDWATVYSARQRHARRLARCAGYKETWLGLLDQCRAEKAPEAGEEEKI